jgi:predicted  nucleic acid-binding Zn-ribbon protein
MAGVILAIVAVAGGGAAWKFYSQRSEQNHELAKEKMKMEAQAAGLNGAQPPPCQTATTALEQKISALNTRIDAAEAKAEAASKKSSSFSADFDGEALERSVKRLQKQVKELQEDKA